ncbi:hypothetical protein CDL15_Pgr012596 [Punica granatum]|uniref:Uncharacterized protein n=1 Tax=Punica granatum TaxID=22663 RepID=A0A218XZC9_PUNGR|nr:hypothetical protein CDL15_Pgr012596 [Punica granatum]
MVKPRAVPQLILKLQDPTERESALRMLSSYLFEVAIFPQFLTSIQMANLLVPLVMHQSPLKVYDNVRAVALSVIGIICQDRELEMIDWAIQSDILEVCWLSIETGNELTKVVGLHILESILQTNFGRSWLLTESNSSQQDKLLKTLGTLVSRGYDIVKEAVASPLLDGTFSNILKKYYPLIWGLLQQLLLIVGKQDSSICSYRKLSA